MECRDQLGTAKLVHAPAQPRDRLVGAEQRVDGERPERHHDLRTDHVDLAEQKRFAGLHLPGFRVPVGGRSTLDDVRNVDLVARQ